MKHGEVHDESKDAYEVLELGEGLQTENEEGQEHLLLVDMETVQEEGEWGHEEAQQEVLGWRGSQEEKVRRERGDQGQECGQTDLQNLREHLMNLHEIVQYAPERGDFVFE